MQHVWQPPQEDAIREHTSTASNDRIDGETQRALNSVTHSAESIRKRLAVLEREWDVDRALMLNFAIIGGLSAGRAMRNKRQTGRLGGWGLVFFTQIGFLAHHAIRRWCPPLPVLRWLGFRSSREISAERVMLEKRLNDLLH